VHIFCVILSPVFEHNCGYHGMLLTQLGHHSIDWVCQSMLIRWVWFNQMIPQRRLSLMEEVRDMECDGE
jgi:hypothetical protein